MNRPVTPPRYQEAQHERQTLTFEIVINDRSYFSRQFSENIEPITRLRYKTRRDLENLHETIKITEQTERAIEQHLLTKLK
jgi:hypothetical protein